MNEQSLNDLTWLKDCAENRFGVKIKNDEEFYVYLVKLSNSILFNYQFPSEIRDSIARVNRRLNKFTNAFDYFVNQVVQPVEQLDDIQSGGVDFEHNIEALTRVQTKFSQTVSSMFESITETMNKTFERNPTEIMNTLKRQIDDQTYSCDTGRLSKTLLHLRSLINVAMYDINHNFKEDMNTVDGKTHERYVNLIKRLQSNIAEIAKVIKSEREECSVVFKMMDKMYEYIAEVLKILLYVRKIETEQQLKDVQGRKQKHASVLLKTHDCSDTKIQLLSRLEMALDDIKIIKEINETLRIFKERNASPPDFIKSRDIKRMNEVNIDIIDEYVNRIERFKDVNSEKGCNELVKIGYELNKIIPDHAIVRNYYEDLQGSIRTYIRITNMARIINAHGTDKRSMRDETSSISLDSNNCKMIVHNDYMKDLLSQKKIMGTDMEHLAKRFYGTYDNMTNYDLYTSNLLCSPSLENAINQVLDGYSIILLLYGYSGSGKTYTLLGDETQLGVLQLSIRSMVNQIDKIKMNVKMLYGVKSTGSTLEISSNRPDPNINMKSYNTNEKVITNNFEENIVNVINDVQTYMTENKYIKETPFNVRSSRSHTFYVLDVYFKNGKVGFLTFADLAGSEDPYKIVEQSLDRIDIKKDGLTKKDMVISREDVRSRIRNLIFSVVSSDDRAKKFDNYTSAKRRLTTNEKILLNSLIDESVYINESLNQMKYFLMKRIVNNPKVVSNVRTNYNIHGLIYPPTIDEKQSKRTPTMKINDKTGMYDLLNDLDKKGIISSLKQTFTTKPTKFILIGTVRTEIIPIFVEGTVNTISFLNKLNVDKSPETIVNENIQRKKLYDKYYEEIKLPTSDELSELLALPTKQMKDMIRTRFKYFNDFIQRMVNKTVNKNDKEAQTYVANGLHDLNIDDRLQEKILEIYTRFIPERTFIPRGRSPTSTQQFKKSQRAGTTKSKSKHRSSRTVSEMIDQAIVKSL